MIHKTNASISTPYLQISNFWQFWQFLEVNEYFQKVLAENHDGTCKMHYFPGNL